MYQDVLSYRKLFQNLIIPWCVEGGIMIFKVPTCIIVYLPLEEMIPGKLFQKKIFHNLVDTLE
jgi:hypothetical protein